jgi:3',5'-cyclic-AMP phosphodiesterase
MSSSPTRIIQISDIHLFAHPDQELLGVKTQESFRAVIQKLSQDTFPIDFLLLTGDLVQDGSQKAYQVLADALKELNIPAYFLPGNHDDVSVMKQVYPYQMISDQRHIILQEWQIILLNSQVPAKVEGYLEQTQFDYLQQCLQECKKPHAIIAFHHQPLAVGARWLDQIGLKNAKQFLDCLSSYPQVKVVLFGHVHQEFEQVVNGVQFYSAPATCFQFKRQQDMFGLEKLAPGYREIILYDDGRIYTKVHRLSHYIGSFDESAAGY